MIRGIGRDWNATSRNTPRRLSAMAYVLNARKNFAKGFSQKTMINSEIFSRSIYLLNYRRNRIPMPATAIQAPRMARQVSFSRNKIHTAGSMRMGTIDMMVAAIATFVNEMEMRLNVTPIYGPRTAPRSVKRRAFVSLINILRGSVNRPAK